MSEYNNDRTDEKVQEILNKLKEEKKAEKNEFPCPECGEILPPDSYFCPYCGTKIKDPEPVKPVFEEPVTQQDFRAEPKIPEPVISETAEKPVKKEAEIKTQSPASAQKTEEVRKSVNTETNNSGEPAAKMNIPFDASSVKEGAAAMKESIEKMNIPEKTKGIKGFVDGMYANVGDALCALAKFAFYVGAVVSIIIGLGIVFGGCQSGFGGTIGGLFSGIIVMAFGIFISWLSTLALYAFGEITRHMKSIDEKLK